MSDAYADQRIAPSYSPIGQWHSSITTPLLQLQSSVRRHDFINPEYMYNMNKPFRHEDELSQMNTLFTADRQAQKQYDLSTAADLNTMVYTGIALSVAALLL
jgi:hypothetical protein